jgi:hypothetical protein
MNKQHRWGGLALLAAAGALLAGSGAALAHNQNPTTTPPPNDTTTVTLDHVPTYHEHIAPILEANCVGCHMAGEFGHDSFQMDSAEQIIAGAEDIALVVSTGYMPPWPPGELSPQFLFDRSLTDLEIQQILAWAEAGAPLGEVSATAAPQADDFAPVVEADLTLGMPELYTPDAALSDDYRCFLLDPGFTEDTFIVGYDILPGNTGIVHHTVLFPGSPAQRAEADSVNGADGKPGWPCFGGTGLTSGGPDLGMMRPLLPVITAAGGIGELRILLAGDDAAARLDAIIAGMEGAAQIQGMIGAVGGTEALVGLLRQGLSAAPAGTNQPVTGVIGAWVPGSTPTQFPDGTGLLIPAGGFVIMQMHYNTQANDQPDLSQLVLDVSNQTDLAAARVLDVQAPVEIPCPDGVTGEACTRESALDQSGDGSDLLLAICGQTLDMYAGQDPANAVSFCNYRVPVSGWAMAIMSHQHKLGVSTRTVLHPDTPEEVVLIDIPVWDFDWQGSYWFADPVWLEEGDIIRLTCTYDNSVSASNPEPRYIVAGEGTSDEMCLNFITMLPAAPGTPAPRFAAMQAAG